MGKIITLTGESGTGKTTITKMLLEHPGFSLVRSTTTRQARSSDLPQEYQYVSLPEFSEIEKQSRFIWTATYAGNHYGTQYRHLDEILTSDQYGIMILVPETVPKLFAYTSAFIPFFLRTPPEEVLRKRLVHRGDKEEDIERRLNNLGSWEAQARSSFIPYHFIENTGRVEDTVEKILSYLN